MLLLNHFKIILSKQNKLLDLNFYHLIYLLCYNLIVLIHILLLIYMNNPNINKLNDFFNIYFWFYLIIQYIHKLMLIVILILIVLYLLNLILNVKNFPNNLFLLSLLYQKIFILILINFQNLSKFPINSIFKLINYFYHPLIINLLNIMLLAILILLI